MQELKLGNFYWAVDLNTKEVDLYYGKLTEILQREGEPTECTLELEPDYKVACLPLAGLYMSFGTALARVKELAIDHLFPGRA